MKVKRQRKILEIITNFEVETQDELIEKLAKSGFAVTQATISRLKDIFPTSMCYST